MKFTIENKKEESLITLSLETSGGNGITLLGTDNKGHVKSLMIFREGRFYRPDSAELEGLETNDEGRIEEE